MFNRPLTVYKSDSNDKLKNITNTPKNYIAEDKYCEIFQNG